MANINLLNPIVAKKANQLIADCKKKNIDIIITQTLRTIEYQNSLYAQGRTKPGRIVTNAKGGQSFHNFGCAFDFAIMENGKIDWNVKNKKWGLVGEIGKKLGLEWGGEWSSFPDFPHFQFTQGLTLSDFQKGKNLA